MLIILMLFYTDSVLDEEIGCNIVENAETRDIIHGKHAI